MIYRKCEDLIYYRYLIRIVVLGYGICSNILQDPDGKWAYSKTKEAGMFTLQRSKRSA